MTETMLQALSIMGKGMAGIFVVIGVIALIVYLLVKVDTNAQK